MKLFDVLKKRLQEYVYEIAKVVCFNHTARLIVLNFRSSGNGALKQRPGLDLQVLVII